MIERHNDIGAEIKLQRDRVLGCQTTGASVDMRSKDDPILTHLRAPRETKYLKPSAIGQNRTRPPHEPVEPSRVPQRLHPGTQHEMVGVGE